MPISSTMHADQITDKNSHEYKTKKLAGDMVDMCDNSKLNEHIVLGALVTTLKLHLKTMIENGIAAKETVQAVSSEINKLMTIKQ